MRKRKAKKRPLLPDPRFNDQLVTRFVNNLMWNGKKSVAFKIFYDSIDIINSKKQARKFIYFTFDQTGKSSEFSFVSDLDNGIQELHFEFINPCSDVTGQQV